MLDGGKFDVLATVSAALDDCADQRLETPASCPSTMRTMGDGIRLAVAFLKGEIDRPTLLRVVELSHGLECNQDHLPWAPQPPSPELGGS